MDAYSKREKIIAGSLNLASICLPIIGPLFALVVSRKSDLIRKNAYRSLAEQIVISTAVCFLSNCYVACALYSIYKSTFEVQGIDMLFLMRVPSLTLLIIWLLNLANTLSSLFDARTAFLGIDPDHLREKWMSRLKQIVQKFSLSL